MKYIIQTTELDEDLDPQLKYELVTKEEFLVKYLHDPKIIYWEIMDVPTDN